MDYTVM